MESFIIMNSSFSHFFYNYYYYYYFSIFLIFFNSFNKNCGGNGNPFLYIPKQNTNPCEIYSWEATIVIGRIFLLNFL